MCYCRGGHAVVLKYWNRLSSIACSRAYLQATIKQWHVKYGVSVISSQPHHSRLIPSEILQSAGPG
jgi:hypothetical protein